LSINHETLRQWVRRRGLDRTRALALVRPVPGAESPTPSLVLGYFFLDFLDFFFDFLSAFFDTGNLLSCAMTVVNG